MGELEELTSWLTIEEEIDNPLVLKLIEGEALLTSAERVYLLRLVSEDLTFA